MADENKLVIEVDAETGKFTTKMGDVTSTFKKMGDTGSGALQGLSVQALGLNAVLELGQKALELYHQGLEAIEKSEAFSNQKLALTNFAGSLGLTQTQVEALIKSIQLASKESLTSAQAQTTAWKLLQAGFTAETIPAVVEFAHRMAETRPEVGGFDAAIQKLSFSLESGTTRGLKQMGIEIQKTGDRHTIMNAILAQADVQMKATGDGYQTFGARLKAISSETSDQMQRSIGKAFEATLLPFMGTDSEKAIAKLDAMKAQVTDLDNKIKQGVTTVSVFNDQYGRYDVIDIAKARAELIIKQNEAQAQLTKGVTAENEEQKKLLDTIGKQEKEKPSVIDPTTAATIKINTNKKMYEQLLADDEAYSSNSEGIAKGLEQARKQQIENRYQAELRNIQGIPMTKQEYAAKELEIEKRKYDAIQQMSDQAHSAEQINNDAAYNLAMQRNVGYEGLATSRIKKEEDEENKSYTQKIQRLQLQQLDEENFNRQAELVATEHQKKLAEIQDRYSKPSIKGMHDGWMNAMADMNKSYGNFANQTSRLTVGMHGVISNSFIQMAKAHKFSVEQMLGNMLEFIGESMIQDGTFKMMSGLFPPNPAMIGVGAAEVALGSALVGSGGGGGASGGGGGTMGGALGTDLMGQQALSSPSGQQMQQKQAQIVINGDLLNSQETVNHIQELIRKNSDVTDFTITAQGKQY